MSHVSYVIGGAVVAAVLVGLWAIKRSRANKSGARRSGFDHERVNSGRSEHDLHHQALIFLVNQKMDSMLAALSRTIESERQNLGAIVRKPSMTAAVDKIEKQPLPIPLDGRPPYERILPMVREGTSVAAIARRLNLSEAEVTTVMRLNAA